MGNASDDTKSGSRRASTEDTIAETSGGARPRVPAPELTSGTTIGRYHVLGQLGRGAMGIVYEAYDPDLDRKVALKVLRFFENTTAPPSEREARLVREAQALAQLSHPNVVAVLDVGRADRKIFIAMELVSGTTLREWLRASPRAWPAVLEVLVAAGGGLAAAHAAGLVHRDVKPDNVMIGDDGRVRVMDFGLAIGGDPAASMQAPIAVGWDPTDSMASSVVSDMTMTRGGMAAGTPAYMSPERHERREIDARSDQFSFCVALYEALYGRRPFRGATPAMTAAAICGEDPQPRPADTKVPAWIHAVILRGLHKDPERRFATMDALLQALARDPRRRRRAWLATAAIAIAATSGWGALQVQARRATAACEASGEDIREIWNDPAAERVEMSLRATGVPHASVAWARARPRIEAWTGSWRSMRAEACRRSTLEKTWSADQGARAAACLDEHGVRLRALLDVFSEADREVVFRVVEAVASLPELGPCLDARTLARRAPDSDDPAERDRLSELRGRLERARALSSSGQYPAARDLATEVLADAEHASAERLELETLVVLGGIERSLDEHSRAQEHLEAAYFGAEQGGVSEIAAHAAISLVSVVGLHGARVDEGLQWARHAEVALGRLELTHDLAWADLLSARAHLHSDRGDHEQAITDHETALAIRREILGNDHPQVAVALDGLSHAHYEQGRQTEAFGYLEEVLAIRERCFGDDHPAVADVLNNLGVARTAAGELPAARALLQRALQIRQQTLGPEHSRVANTLTALGDLAFAENDLREAVRLNREALAIREKVWSADHPMVAQSLNNLGAALNLLREHEEAAGVFRRAIEILETRLGPRHAHVLLVRWGLARAELGRGESVRGRRALDDALRDFADGRDPNDPLVAAYRADYADAVWAVASESERPSLLELARQALAILRAAGPDHADDVQRVEAWLAAHESPKK